MFDTNDENIFLDDITTADLSKGNNDTEVFKERILTLAKRPPKRSDIQAQVD